MKKNQFNILIDFLSALCFLVVAKTGLIIFFFLPDGVRRGGYQEFFGITKNTYINIHNWAGVIFIIFIILHIILHWPWIISIIKNRYKNNE